MKVEKHQGVTLVTRDGWFTVVWDATGHSVEGPFQDEQDLKRCVALAIPVLRQLSA